MQIRQIRHPIALLRAQVRAVYEQVRTETRRARSRPKVDRKYAAAGKVGQEETEETPEPGSSEPAGLRFGPGQESTESTPDRLLLSLGGSGSRKFKKNEQTEPPSSECVGLRQIRQIRHPTPVLLSASGSGARGGSWQRLAEKTRRRVGEGWGLSRALGARCMRRRIPSDRTLLRGGVGVSHNLSASQAATR